MNAKTKVLITEDRKEICSKCAAVLKNNGIEMVIVPKDGLKALAAIREHHPIVAVLDVFMPQLDAIGVMNELKKSGFSPMPVFMTQSSFDNPGL